MHQTNVILQSKENIWAKGGNSVNFFSHLKSPVFQNDGLYFLAVTAAQHYTANNWTLTDVSKHCVCEHNVHKELNQNLI